MPGKPEQGAFELNDVKRPAPSTDPDTYEGARRTIAGGRHGVKPNPTDPLLKGATELREEPQRKEIPPYTHTVPKGREVWCFDGDPGRAPFATRTTETLRLAATGQTRLVALRGRKPEFTAVEPFATHLEGNRFFDHSAGTVVVTPYAKPRKLKGMRPPPSSPLI